MGTERRPDNAHCMGDRLLNVIVVECQIHGYRQGHQLLAGSVQLSREDQAVVDRLSDVAGPLRPREKFAPYLTGYPLPSGDYYVLARTWLDLTVTRAGCVRTMSVIIPTAQFATAESLSPYLDLLKLDRLPEDGDAKRVAIEPAAAELLPPVPDFEGNELLEALFLEAPQPVVVFDAPLPELVTTRLLTALWPSMRRQFAVSTFALSPRKVDGRDFNLVFAPKDARSKFSDWNGRRIDAHSAQDSRHRWTSTIVDRVFQTSLPRLLSPSSENLVVGPSDAGDNAAALRIALLWDELVAKLNTTPTAALGLLDIANSGKVRGTFAQQALEPSLVDAIQRAPLALSESEAWTFLSAIARKLLGRPMPRGMEAVSSTVAELAERSPEGAVALLSRPDDRGVVKWLRPFIANGIAIGFADRAGQTLLLARPTVLASLVAESPLLAVKVANDALLIDRLGEILPRLDSSIAASLGEVLLPHLIFDWQLPAAGPLLEILDCEQLVAEIRHLGIVNDFAAPKIAGLCLQRAGKLGAKRAVLAVLIESPRSQRRNNLLARALDASVEDATWLLRLSGLSDDVVANMFAGLLRRADDLQLGAILGDSQIGPDAIGIVERTAPDLLRRIVFIDQVPLEVFVRIAGEVLGSAFSDGDVNIAKKALERCLGLHFGGDEIAFITTMLGVFGERLDGAWAARLGLSNGIPASVASRNLEAFHKAPKAARFQFVRSTTDIAKLLRERRTFDLSAAAAEACAHFILEAEQVEPDAALRAAGYLLPMLMKQYENPVSVLIAAAFPIIYLELAKKDEVPDLLKIVPFFDWDRCKAARQELVSAFMSSAWPPCHLALIACRCSDAYRILQRTAKAPGGMTYISRIASDLKHLPMDCRKSVERIIDSL